MSEYQDIGLFTFYVQQGQDDQQLVVSRGKKWRVKDVRASQGHSLDKSIDNDAWNQEMLKNSIKLPQRKASDKKSEQSYNKYSKLCSNMVPVQPSQNEQSRKVQKPQKVHSITKYPKKNATISTSALLKANLDYLTTQHEVPIDSYLKMEENEPKKQKKEDHPYQRTKTYFNHVKMKPILKGIDLNHHVADVVDLIEQRKLTQKTKLGKTRNSLKSINKVASFQSLGIQNKQPLISNICRNRQEWPRFNKYEEMPPQNKLKKGQSQKWKNPTRQPQEAYLHPVGSDRRTMVISTSGDCMSQEQNHFRFTQVQKSPSTKYKLLKKVHLSEKPVFLSQKSQLLRTIFLQDRLP